jgi:hypothetical protein
MILPLEEMDFESEIEEIIGFQRECIAKTSDKENNNFNMPYKYVRVKNVAKGEEVI